MFDKSSKEKYFKESNINNKSNINVGDDTATITSNRNSNNKK